MKRLSNAMAGVGVILALLTGSAQAARIYWQDSVDMYDTSTNQQDFVDTTDSLVLAISTSSGKTGTSTINGVPFVQLTSAAFAAGETQNGVTIQNSETLGAYDGFGWGSFSDSAVGDVIASSTYGASTVTLSGLTSGQWYMIQLMSNDSRSGRHSNFQIGLSDGVNDFSTSMTSNTAGYCSLSNRDPSDSSGEASGDYILGYFQADGTTQSIETSGSTDGFASANSTSRAQINGFQLRALAAAPDISFDTPPAAPGSVVARATGPSEATVTWSAVADVDSYILKRSDVSGGPYATLATLAGTVTNYTDSSLPLVNKAYYYVVASSNEFGQSDDSAEARVYVLDATIIDNGAETYGAAYEVEGLFDDDTTTHYDTKEADAWGGLDYGSGNEKQIVEIQYILRNYNDASVLPYASNSTFQAANDTNGTWTTLHTVPVDVLKASEGWNVATVSDLNTYRYVRILSAPGLNNKAFAEIKFYSADQFTTGGTLKTWLDDYYDVAADFGGDYEAADASDTDGDGLTAQEEYEIGSDPTDAASPAGAENLYAWPTAPSINTVYWDASDFADTGSGGGYIVYRSLDDTNYTAVALVTGNQYVDGDVTNGVAYYYKASVTNASYGHESALSDSEFAVPNQYQIIGSDSTWSDRKDLSKYEVFDGMTGTYFDGAGANNYAGLDYGAGNARQVYTIRYHLRSWSSAYVSSTNAVFWGSNVEPTGDLSESNNWTQLAVIPEGNTSTSDYYELETGVYDAFRYVFLTCRPSDTLNFIAEIEYLTDAEYTFNGTSKAWLDSYYDVETEFFGDYVTADYSDTDGDGFLAYMEYELGSDPTDPDSLPAGPLNLYAVPEGAHTNVVYWDASDMADVENGGGYVVYRSLDDTNYTSLATVAVNTYTDGDVVGGVTYYYRVSATNAGYAAETALSASASVLASQYLIIGYGTPYSDEYTMYKPFDDDTGTHFDSETVDAWVGLDYGSGNAQNVQGFAFVLRGYSSAVQYATNAVIQGANSADWSDAVDLMTVTVPLAANPAWNYLTNAASAGPYRYVRIMTAPQNRTKSFAEIRFLTDADFTADGTPNLWLDNYYDVAAEFGGDYDAAAASDTDGDGLTAAEEYAQGSDPTDQDDPTPQVFNITGAAPQATGDGIVISWESSAAKTYSVWTNASLISTNGWAEADTGIAGGDGSTSYTGTVNEAVLYFKVTTP